MRKKYVIVDDSYPILFGEYYQHDFFANKGEITSAGFYSIDFEKKKVVCYGESISLKVKSNPDYDAYLIESLLFG